MSVLLGYISSAIKTYLPLKLMPQYKKKFFDILKKILEKQLSSIECNKEIIKNALININGYATEDEDKKYLIKLLNLESKMLTQSRRFQYVRTIFTSPDIPLADKELLYRVLCNSVIIILSLEDTLFLSSVTILSFTIFPSLSLSLFLFPFNFI